MTSLTSSNVLGETADEPAHIVSLPVIAVEAMVGTVTLGWDHIPDSFDPDSLNPLLTVIGLSLKSAQARRADQEALRLDEYVAARTQELAIALDKAEEANRAKSQLLSTVAHELRTPLAVIKAHVTTFLAYYDRLAKDRQLQYLSIMNEEADRLNAMVTSLLDMSRLESGRLEIKCARIEPLLVVDELMEEVQARFKDRSFLRATPSDLAPIRADAERTRQVLANLVDNASKYSPAGLPIEIGARPWDDGVEFWVKDRGNGLTPEQIRRVFEPFYQINGNTQNARGGVGLGLAICKGLIEEMGGRIWCSSTGSGQGSKFSFLLPWAADEKEPDPDPSPAVSGKIG